MSSDVIILGGGAAGCATAYFLGQAGVKSTIVEVDAVASQASGFAAGQLSPLWGPPLLMKLSSTSFQMQLDMAEELIESSGVDFNPRKSHMLLVAFDESGLDDAKARYHERTAALAWAGGRFPFADDMSVSMLTAEETLAHEPRVADDVVGSLDTFGFLVVDPYQHTLAVYVAAERLGATLRPGRATGLKTSGTRVTSVTLEDGEIEGDAVVLAMGPWSGETGSWLSFDVPVGPLRGELLHVDLPGPPMDKDISWGHASTYPRSDGLVRIGHTQERRGFDKQPDDAVGRRLLEGAVRMIPAMADARLVRHTVCLRPETPDSLPMIGRVPGWDNAYFATGAGSKGILLGLGIGKAVSDQITEGGTDLPIESCVPERFANRG